MAIQRPKLKISHQSIYFLILVSFVYVVAYAVFLARNPRLLVNLFGVVSLLLYGGSLYPGIVRTVLPELKQNAFHRWSLKNRRQVGVASFCFALTHAILAFLIREINMSDPMTYVNYATGLVSFAIMIILTVTSNDYSVKSLKKAWSQLHKLTYALVAILPLHLVATMQAGWTSVTPISSLFMSVILILFIQRILWRPPTFL